MKTTEVPAATATVPSTGPMTVPKIAEANTDPSISPRRSRGEIAITQASPPPQMQPQAIPWMNRRPSRAAKSEPNPKATVAPVNSSRPTTVVRRTPARVAIQPPSSDPGSIPAG